MISAKKCAIILLVLGRLNGYETANALAGRLSIEVSPSLSISRIYNSNSNTEKIKLKDHAISPALGFGLAYHFPLQAHCSLSTGLSYTLGCMAVVPQERSELSETYLLQSIWIPILCRLYTSEIQLDTSIYFKLGIIPSISLPKRLMRSLQASEGGLVTVRPLNCWVHLGGGIKYDFSLTNSLTVGISYCGDITGIMHTKKLYVHNHFFCLDFCLLF